MSELNKSKAFFDRLASNWDTNEKSSKESLYKVLEPLRINKGNRVLDIACGTGIITGIISDISEASVVGIDLSSEMIKIAENKYKGNKTISFINEDFLTCPLSAKFDYAIIFNAYPHFTEPERLASRLSEVLSSGGRAAIVHNIGRRGIRACHENVDRAIARPIGSPAEEAEFFRKLFNIDLAREDDFSYYLLMTKK